ncbi:MAG: MaoC family dehydratase [Kofleriaceae bacterium]|nr:MaoC family dehydratase [Kofleriaceae bacterium]MCB9571018.1 MaoC family dehydratase [Kofleriaceae bacterium]
MKATTGHFFEDFSIGMRLQHAVPRTVHGGDLALYISLTGDRRPVSSSTELARSLGYAREVAHDLLAFHLVFGKTVSDVSLNAVANLGYANVRFSRPVYPGDTLLAETEVIGLRELSNGKAGVVYVTSRGFNQKGQEVLSFHRWVMVNKRDPSVKSGIDQVPELPAEVAPEDLPVPECLNLSRFEQLSWATGGRHRWDDYDVGERIHHHAGMTIEEADHVQATRLYQNLAKVHFDAHAMKASRFGKRLIYGGHVISVAHALSYNGLENLLGMAAWNSGSHANPTFAGDTIYAWTDVLAKAEVPGHRDLGALRLRLVAVKDVDPTVEEVPLEAPAEDGKKAGFDPRVVLVLDYWGLMPRRRA